MLKQKIKRGMHQFAAKYGPHARTRSAPQLLILMYHRTLPNADKRTLLEEPGMTVSPETLRMNLEVLSDYFDFISLNEWLERKLNSQPLPRKACVISFDDGWADNYEYAFPILYKAAVPATIFIVAGMIGSGRQFWPERLALIMREIAEKYPHYWQHPELHWLRQAKTSFAFTDAAPTREQIAQISAHAKQNTDLDNHARLDRIEN